MRSGLSTLLILIILVVWSPTGKSDEPPQPGYSAAPLAQSVFAPAHVVLETSQFNNWLNDNYLALSEVSKKSLREHLFYLIDSRVKEIFATTGEILPRKTDLLLSALFGWAERLGVYGGSLVFNSIKSPTSPEQSNILPLPTGVQLELVGDLFVLRSDLGKWSVKFPYYFMLHNIRDFRATNGKRLQIVVISTGAARHKNGDGWSQATLIIFFSPEMNSVEFLEFQGGLLGVNIAESRPLGIDKLRVHEGFDTEHRIYKELTIWETLHGAIGVAYLGVDGTFQWNRLHFLNFVRAIESKL